MKPCWALLTLAILWVEIQNGACQQVSRRKEAGENLIRPGGKQAKFRYPELKEKAAGGRGQLGESVSLSRRNNIELRYKDRMYSCWVTLCDGSECLKDPDRTSRTSNYFTDKDDVFVPSAIHFEIVYLHPDRTAVIPCRVTSPLDKVSLHREVPPE
ncbi:unnamed protein product [Coregonus sp. 'balchen']|nr:unnamed protein product [Coregonus sp. 'balchen']